MTFSWCGSPGSGVPNKSSRARPSISYLRDRQHYGADLQTSPLLHQRIARCGEFVEILRVAAAIRVHRFGGASVGLVDFRRGKTAAEGQSEHLPITFFRRERLIPALAEARHVKRMQGVANEAQATARDLFRASIRFPERGVAQARQRLRGRVTEHRLLALSRDLGRKLRGFAIIGRGSRPNLL